MENAVQLVLPSPTVLAAGKIEAATRAGKNVFLTGDTLALHVATALGKKVVAYFGPTSAAEIDAYEKQVVKVQADLDCLVCYKTRCDFNPNCMNSLTSEHMFSMLESAIGAPATR